MLKPVQHKHILDISSENAGRASSSQRQSVLVMDFSLVCGRSSKNVAWGKGVYANFILIPLQFLHRMTRLPPPCVRGDQD